MAANGTRLLRIVYLGGDCVLRLAYHMSHLLLSVPVEENFAS